MISLELVLQAPTNGAVTVFPARTVAPLRSEEVAYVAERADQVPSSWRRVCGVWMQVSR